MQYDTVSDKKKLRFTLCILGQYLTKLLFRKVDGGPQCALSEFMMALVASFFLSFVVDLYPLVLDIAEDAL